MQNIFFSTGFGNIFSFFMRSSWLSYTWRKETYLPFSSVIPEFLTLKLTKHICLFHVLLLILLRLGERNIFVFLMGYCWLCYTWTKETYLPFSCLVPYFVTFLGRKHICVFHALFLTFLHSMKHIFLFHPPAGIISPLVHWSFEQAPKSHDASCICSIIERSVSFSCTTYVRIPQTSVQGYVLNENIIW